MKVKGMLRGLLLAYGLTGIMLLLLAFLLFRFDLKENMVSMGIVVVYILSCFLGGIIAGRCAGTRKYLWAWQWEWSTSFCWWGYPGCLPDSWRCRRSIC